MYDPEIMMDALEEVAEYREGVTECDKCSVEVAPEDLCSFEDEDLCVDCYMEEIEAINGQDAREE